MRRGFLSAALAALAINAAPAIGHHSFAMFDRRKPVVLEGKVLELQWTNPHVWIQMSVRDAQGADVEWGIECTSVNMLRRQGWHHDSLHRGDRVKLLLYPLHDGSHGGQLARLLEVNGAASNLSSYR
jgi:Family of unknown function (DUF6152)